MCIGGPPCPDLNEDTSSAKITSKSTSSWPTTTSVAELSRVVLSTDNAHISIFYGKKLIMIYQQSLIPGNVPPMFTYELQPSDVELLKSYVGKKITITSVIFSGTQKKTISNTYTLQG